MMPLPSTPLLVLVLLLNFLLLGTSRLRAVHQRVGAAGRARSAFSPCSCTAHRCVLALAHRRRARSRSRAVLIPAHAPARDARGRDPPRDRALRRASSPRCCSARSAPALAVLFAQHLPLAPEHTALAARAGLARDRADRLPDPHHAAQGDHQVVGYLVLENGIFVMGLAPARGDAVAGGGRACCSISFVGIFVMGIIINHISREFSSLDTARLSRLKE